ncbi:MAG: Ltp family lipoprotein [Ruminococcus sp.]|nr:Ltp family lipoprotein [Ruminococcus sp.]
MKCRACGKEFDGAFCPECGTAVNVNYRQQPQPQSYTKSKGNEPLYKRWWFWVIIGTVIITVSSMAFSRFSGKSSDSGSITSSLYSSILPTESTKASADNKKSSTLSKSTASSKSAGESSDSVPMEYKNALKSAENYNSLLHMSKKAIYDQLTSEFGDKFSAEAAQYAVDNLNADYKENALKSAKSYQRMMNMSKSAIYDQLTSEYGDQFTEEEAQYAVDNLE